MKKRKKISAKNWIGAGVMILILAGLDQWVKWLAVLYLKDKAPFVVIEGVFEFFYLENRGAAFGIFQNQRWIFLILTALIMVGLVWLYGRIPAVKRYVPLRICIVASFAGAVGNMIDRIKNGYVVDFLYFKLIDFPVFNIADIYVTLSVILAMVLFLFYYNEEEIQDWIRW